MEPRLHEHGIGLPAALGTIRTLYRDGASPPRITLDIAPAALVKLFIAFLGVEMFLRGWPVLIVVMISLMLAAAFSPLVRRLQARITRTWAVATVVISVVIVLVGCVVLIAPPVFHDLAKLIEAAPIYVTQLEGMLARHHIHINITSQVQSFSSRITGYTPRVFGMLSGVIDGVAGAVCCIFLTVYLLIEGPRSGNSLLRLLPRDRRAGARALASQLGTQIGGYIRGQIILSVLAGIFTFIVTYALGVPDSLALSAIAGICDCIPLIGILMGLIPPALMALTLSPTKALIVVFCYIFYHQLESQIISPNVFGNTMGLPLTIIVIAFFTGLEVLGIVGAVLALPVAAAIPSIVAYIQQWQEEQESSPH